MPRQDLDNRDRDGQFQNRYSEPLSSKKIGVYLFESDDDRVRAIAQKLGMSATEVVRYLVKNSLNSKSNLAMLEDEDKQRLGNINIELSMVGDTKNIELSMDFYFQHLVEKARERSKQQISTVAALMQDEQFQNKFVKHLASKFKNHRKNENTVDLMIEEAKNFLNEEVDKILI